MSTLQGIEDQIKVLEQKLESAAGTETEVYTRIVGYYRAVKNWNKGKKEEYRHRICFSSLEKKEAGTLLFSEMPESEIQSDSKTQPQSRPDSKSYMYFYRKTCPNCPSVRNYVEKLDIEGRHIDADSAEGLEIASQNNILSVPAVIFFDSNHNEAFRAFSIKELQENLLLAV